MRLWVFSQIFCFNWLFFFFQQRKFLPIIARQMQKPRFPTWFPLVEKICLYLSLYTYIEIDIDIHDSEDVWGSSLLLGSSGSPCSLQWHYECHLASLPWGRVKILTLHQASPDATLTGQERRASLLLGGSGTPDSPQSH